MEHMPRRERGWKKGHRATILSALVPFGIRSFHAKVLRASSSNPSRNFLVVPTRPPKSSRLPSLGRYFYCLVTCTTSTHFPVADVADVYLRSCRVNSKNSAISNRQYRYIGHPEELHRPRPHYERPEGHGAVPLGTRLRAKIERTIQGKHNRLGIPSKYSARANASPMPEDHSFLQVKRLHATPSVP